MAKSNQLLITRRKNFSLWSESTFFYFLHYNSMWPKPRLVGKQSGPLHALTYALIISTLGSIKPTYREEVLLDLLGVLDLW